MARTIRDCTVAVIGGAGFLGSHCVDTLINDRKCKVLVIDNLCAGRREFVHKDAVFFHHDITTGEGYLHKIFTAHQVEYVLNYAAWPYIPDSFLRPVHVFATNAMGAMHVINAAHEAGCKGILQVSSAEIYGDAGTQRYLGASETAKHKAISETDEVRPHSSYGASKAAVDYFCQVAWRERRTPVIALRQFNCVGGRDVLHPYVIPEIINQLLAQRNLPIKAGGYVGATVKLGNNSSRDFLYAGDQARIAVELLECGEFGEVYNLGSESSIKIYDLAKLVGKLMGFADVQVVEDSARKRPWEIWSLTSCNGKIRAVCPSVANLTPLEEALRRTIKWLEENR